MICQTSLYGTHSIMKRQYRSRPLADQIAIHFDVRKCATGGGSSKGQVIFTRERHQRAKIWASMPERSQQPFNRLRCSVTCWLGTSFMANF